MRRSRAVGSDLHDEWETVWCQTPESLLQRSIIALAVLENCLSKSRHFLAEPSKIRNIEMSGRSRMRHPSALQHPQDRASVTLPGSHSHVFGRARVKLQFRFRSTASGGLQLTFSPYSRSHLGALLFRCACFSYFLRRFPSHLM